MKREALLEERTISRAVPIRAARSQVFRALMDPGTLSRWLFAAVAMTPEPGSAFSFEWRDSAAPATAQGEILELIVGEKLVLSWYMEADGVTTTAAFVLEDTPDGTLLRFTHSGLPQEPEWLPRLQAVALEWDKVLLNLRFLLEEQGEGKHLFYLRTQVSLPALVQRAFRAWTTAAGLGGWLVGDAFIIPEEGHALRGVTLDTGKVLNARLEKIEPDRHLRFTWSEGGVRGLLGVSFWPASEGTVMTLTLRSFALMELERSFVEGLWQKRFQRLAAYLTRPPLTKELVGRGKVILSRPLEAPPGRVWNALTDSGVLRRWFVKWTDFEPRSGAPFVFLWNAYGEISGRVKKVKSEESITFSWDIPELQETTEVSIWVRRDSAQEGVCTVELEHAGWGDGPDWEMQRQSHESGWANALAQLEFYLRHGAGKEVFELHLRRSLPLPLDRAVPLLTTARGWQTWLARRASFDPRVDGEIKLELPDGVEYQGRVVALHSSGDGAAEFTKPVPIFLEWGFAPDKEDTRIGLTFTSYSSSPQWTESAQDQWRQALDRIAAGG